MERWSPLAAGSPTGVRCATQVLVVSERTADAQEVADTPPSVHVSHKVVSPTKALKKSLPPQAAAKAATDLIRRANAEADQKAADRARSAMERHVTEAVSGAARVRRVWAACTPGERALTLLDIADRVHTIGPATAEYDRDELAAVADRWRWYAKWAAKLDKLSIRDGFPAPYGGQYPSGVVAIVPGPDACLLELSSLVAPVVAGANAAVLTAERGSSPVRALVDVLAVDALPTGLVRVVESVPGITDVLATHPGVDGLDLQGCAADVAGRCTDLAGSDRRLVQPDHDVDWTEKPGKSRLRAWYRPVTPVPG